MVAAAFVMQDERAGNEVQIIHVSIKDQSLSGVEMMTPLFAWSSYTTSFSLHGLHCRDCALEKGGKGKAGIHSEQL